MRDYLARRVDWRESAKNLLKAFRIVNACYDMYKNSCELDVRFARDALAATCTVLAKREGELAAAKALLLQYRSRKHGTSSNPCGYDPFCGCTCGKLETDAATDAFLDTL